MKIVINACYGGFGLSHEGIMEYAKRKGMTLHAFVNARKHDGRIDFDKMIPYEPDKRAFCVFYSTEPLDDNGKIPDKSYFSERDIKRDDPDLIAVVQTLGKKANGDFANLQVVDIPDGVQWEIDEYDGFEHIDEVHRSWS